MTERTLNRSHLIISLGMLVLLFGCAMKSDVRRVEAQLASHRTEMLGADSARTALTVAMLDAIASQQSDAYRIIDSLAVSLDRLGQSQGALRGDLRSVATQLVAVRELAGQSQTRLAELRTQLSNAGTDQQEDLFLLGQRHLDMGSTSTARAALVAFLEQNPEDGRIKAAYLLLGDIDDRDGNLNASLGWYHRLTDDPRKSPERSAACQRLRNLNRSGLRSPANCG
jgi:TolA-binding protein